MSLKVGAVVYYQGHAVQVESVVPNRGRAYVRRTESSDSPFAGWVDMSDLSVDPGMLWVSFTKDQLRAVNDVLLQADTQDAKDGLARIQAVLYG